MTRGANRVIDVLDRSSLKTAHCRIVFFMLAVPASLLQGLDCSMKAIGVLKMWVDRRMIATVLSVVVGGIFDFTDRGIDLVAGNAFILLHVWIVDPIQQAARIAYVLHGT